MGDTLDTITTDAGARVAFVLAIEGYSRILTDHADTSAALAAWSGTDWTLCLSGLVLDGEWTQELNPWDPTFEAPSLRFQVIPTDGSDTFGNLVHAVAGGDEAYISSDVDYNDSTISIVDTSDLGGAPGNVWIGPECVRYTIKNSNSLSGCTRGYWSPFTVNGGGRFARQHKLADVDYSARLPVKATDAPRQWVGRNVALYMHVIRGDTWDTKAEAQLVFAGDIVEVMDGADGITSVECRHVLDALNSKTVFHDQFRAIVPDGFYLRNGWKFVFAEAYVPRSGTITPVLNKATLTVISEGGTPGTGEINAGWYGAEEIASIFNDFCQASSDLDQEWQVSLKATDVGYRFAIESTQLTGGYVAKGISVRGGSSEFWKFLGYTPNNGAGGPGVGSIAAAVMLILGNREPAKAVATMTGERGKIQLDATFGTWFDNRPYLPSHLVHYTASGEQWGILQIGDTWALARRIDDTEFDDVVPLDLLGRKKDEQTEEREERISLSQDGEIQVKQVVLIETSLADFLIKLFASTGTGGYNHTTHDALTYGLGLAIPWSILGDNFVQSTKALSESDSENGCRVILEKPTTLPELIGADLIVRGAKLVWKNGGLRFVTWATPNALTAAHTLTEANKASAVTGDDQRSTVHTTDRYMRNIVRFEYQRTLRGDYQRVAEFRFQRSVDDYGERALTVKLRNQRNIHDAETLMRDFAANVLPIWGQPLHQVTRTINFNLFENVAVGDVALVSDDFVRDPTTGNRGLTTKPMTIMGHRYGWGSIVEDIYGEVDLVFNPFDRSAGFAPAAEIDDTYTSGTFTNGYSSSTLEIRVKANAFSLASEADDVTHHSIGDKILIYEIDADSTPDSWERTIIDINGNDIEINSALTSPAFDTAKRYRVTSQIYSQATAGQQSAMYMADQNDYKIENLRVPFEWGIEFDAGDFTDVDLSSPPDFEWPQMIGLATDGSPVHPGILLTLCNTLNHATNYYTAPNLSYPSASGANTTVIGATRTLLRLPIFQGVARPPPGKVRKLYVQPIIFRQVSGASATITGNVALSEPVHPFGLGENPEYPPSTRSVTWTTTSTSDELGSLQGIPLPGNGRPIVWFTIDADEHGGCRGAPVIYIGPLEDA